MTRPLHTDRSNHDRAVSPVIGAVLMVAITVVMAAAVGTLVLDLGGTSADPAPRATLAVTADPTTNHLNVSHRGGDGIDAARSRLLVTDESTGDRLTFPPTTDSSVFGVGGVVAIDVSDGNVTSTTWGAMSASESSGFDVTPGTQYTLQLVDARSQRIVFETTVTA